MHPFNRRRNRRLRSRARLESESLSLRRSRANSERCASAAVYASAARVRDTILTRKPPGVLAVVLVVLIAAGCGARRDAHRPSALVIVQRYASALLTGQTTAAEPLVVSWNDDRLGVVVFIQALRQWNLKRARPAHRRGTVVVFPLAAHPTASIASGHGTLTLHLRETRDGWRVVSDTLDGEIRLRDSGPPIHVSAG
jgi:hypothetical protein